MDLGMHESEALKKKIDINKREILLPYGAFHATDYTIDISPQ